MELNELMARQEQAVIDGAEWLDEEVPGWVDKINLDTFALADGRMCICGQVFEELARRYRTNGYDYAVDRMFPSDSWYNHDTSTFSQSHGFVARPESAYLENEEEFDNWGYAEMIWAEQIEKRRADKGTI